MNLDDLTLSYIAKSLGEEELAKAIKGINDESLEKAVGRMSGSKTGLVYVQKPVSKNGKTHMQGFWVKASEAETNKKQHAKEMTPTDKLHKGESGKYTKERGKLHDKIIDEIVSQCEKPAPGQKPIAILMGGGSASGKSTMRKNVIDTKLNQEGIKAGTVDADEIKDGIPEYASLKNTHPDHAARLVHEESSDIGSKMLNRLIGEGRHFVYDGTMKSKEKYEKLVDKLKDAGYEVHIYVADVPLEEAIKRSDARAERTGRKVPHEIIESSHRGVPKTLEAIKDKVASYKVFDNSKELTLIGSNDYVHPELYTKFLDKGGVKFRATSEK